MEDTSSAPAGGEPLSPNEDNWTLVEGEPTTTETTTEKLATTEMTDTLPEITETKSHDSDKCPASMGPHDFKDDTCTGCGFSRKARKYEEKSSEQETSVEEVEKPSTEPEVIETKKKAVQDHYPTSSAPSEHQETKDEKPDTKSKEKEKEEAEKAAAAKKLEEEKEKKKREEKEKLEDERRVKVSTEKEIKGEKSSEPQIELKFILIGDAGVGKTNLMSRFINDEYDMATISTISIGSARKPIIMADGQKIRINVWDTAGQERYRAIARSFYKGLNAIFIVYDCADPPTLTSVSDWYDEVKQHCDTNPEVVLIGNKIDLAVECSHFVSEEDARIVANEHKMFLFNTSAKTGDNCQRVLNKTIELCYDKILKGEVGKVIAETPVPVKQKSGCC